MSLLIITWGRLRHKHRPLESQKNWYVGMLTLPTDCPLLDGINGTDQQFIKCIDKDSSAHAILRKIAETINEGGYTVISISCEYGVHRAVALAELLKKHHYPEAEICHLDLLKE